MVDFPEPFVRRMRALLGEEAESFFSALQSPAPVSLRLNQAKPVESFREEKEVAWCAEGRLLLQRPSFTQDPLFQAGCYYVQEASSMFLGSAYRQLFGARAPERVLDLCAAPGGKSTHLRSLLPPESLLVSNELIASRNQVLVQNLVKWGNPGIVVTQSDPEQFRRLPDYFDLVVVDAPCSGEGLFRKDPAAIDEWSENAVEACAIRQTTILASAWEALAPGGVLFYSTCTYEPAENEEQVERLRKLGAEILQLQAPQGVDERSGCLRFYPHRIAGEGFFFCALRKTEGSVTQRPRPGKSGIQVVQDPRCAAYLQFVDQWQAFRVGPHLHVIAQRFVGALHELAAGLTIRYAGVRVGEIMGDQLIPAPELAFSTALSDTVRRIELDDAQAIRFLKGEALRFNGALPGWCLVTTSGYGLGWVKVVSDGRANNHFPKGWRIRH